MVHLNNNTILHVYSCAHDVFLAKHTAEDYIRITTKWCVNKRYSRLENFIFEKTDLYVLFSIKIGRFQFVSISKKKNKNKRRKVQTTNNKQFVTGYLELCLCYNFIY